MLSILDNACTFVAASKNSYGPNREIRPWYLEWATILDTADTFINASTFLPSILNGSERVCSFEY